MRDSTKGDPIKNTAEKEHLPLEVVQMDVDKCESVKNALDKIIDEESRIDILVNNAGYGLFGALEDISIEDVRKQYETNVFGVIRIVQRGLPIMRA
jgi:NAD(P)-dependent dehydrogenase (short-subunit alcohol dehydrogenase family)